MREEDAGQALPPRGRGWERRHTHTPGCPCGHSCPVRTAAAWLEGEIISSRISGTSRKNSANYSLLISFHFIMVCLSFTLPVLVKSSQPVYIKI